MQLLHNIVRLYVICPPMDERVTKTVLSPRLHVHGAYSDVIADCLRRSQVHYSPIIAPLCYT